MMKLLVLQHVDVEHPGVFRDLWASERLKWVPIQLDAGEDIPSFDSFDAMVVMGGPMDVWQEDLHPWLRTEKQAIREWVRGHDKPFLGICLGHQLLADALGGAVAPMGKPEVGLVDVDVTPAGQQDPVLSGMGATMQTFQWHGAEVVRLPEDAVVLAANTACPVQAFRCGRRAYGFQFHCEITETTVADWKRLPAYRASLEETLGREGSEALAGRVASRLPDFEIAARRLNQNFLALL